MAFYDRIFVSLFHNLLVMDNIFLRKIVISGGKRIPSVF